MDVIDQFIDRYAKEYDFYTHVGRVAAQMLETSLRAAGVRAIVSSRAKSMDRLEQKCRQRRDSGKDYGSVDDIYDDIPDLVGVRVALYFPGQRNEVEGAILQLFHPLSPKKIFPDPQKVDARKRFAGYHADHYRVCLRENELTEGERRFAAAKIEVQVASVIMHAWAEVEHDLVYKPMAGQLSEDEHSLLDQLNGLVMTGEIALEGLQRAGETRVTVEGRLFWNHYDLAAYLLERARGFSDSAIGESGLGRVDLLFKLARTLEVHSPDKLSPYLEALHGDVSQRPLAEQVIDSLLAEDSSRYELFNRVRAEATPGVPRGPEWEDFAPQGAFISYWGRLEGLLRDLAEIEGVQVRFPSPTRLRPQLSFLGEFALSELVSLQRFRNELVHGRMTPSQDEMSQAVGRLEHIINRIRSYIQTRGGLSSDQA